MKPMIPEPRLVLTDLNKKVFFDGLVLDFSGCEVFKDFIDFEQVVSLKMSSVPNLAVSFNTGENGNSRNCAMKNFLAVSFLNYIPEGHKEKIPSEDRTLFEQEGYVLNIALEGVKVYALRKEGFVNGLSTLKCLIQQEKGTFSLPLVTILDYPLLPIRSISTTFAWYAGYARVGFDMQLWGKEEWESFVLLCSDFKINQINMCMYGYWPFSFPEYPETELRNFPMKVWNPESRNWIQIAYTHPNISNPFLEDLIRFAHSLGISVCAYIGLNSYNGGFAAEHPEKRMVPPLGGRFINDFDSLCPSLPENIEYLKASVRKVASLGFDGIIFEESEESFWFCQCDSCKKRFVETTPSPAEAKHKASYWLLSILVPEIKKVNPDCRIGLRAWREPPLSKSLEYLEYCRNNIPQEVSLYWSPGLYVDESEFEKWLKVFGSERICGRDSESNAWAATQGRLFRLFRKNILRGDSEPNDQFIEKDIEQHIGSLRHRVKGINGYLFEWYGYFLHLFAHSQYGWGSLRPAEEFYPFALRSVFGEEIAEDILFVLENIFTIHEAQIGIYQLDFPFLKNKVKEEDRPFIQEALRKSYEVEAKIDKILSYLNDHKEISLYIPHFEKLLNCVKRNREIYALCIASLNYEKANTIEERKKWLREIFECNEKDFELVKAMYFDIQPINITGVKVCMYPYYELKRVVTNELFPERYDPEPIYPGVEALGWLWIDKKY